MSLIRQSPPPSLVVAPDALAEHLRLPHAAPETEQTVELATLIRAATAAIERRLSTALVAQGWLWRTADPAHPLPLSPVISVDGVEIVGLQDTRTPWTGWTLARDMATPRLAARSFPSIPTGGHVEIAFTAGYGPAPDAVPEDLRHAVTLMAAHFYEHRTATDDPRTPLPLGVAGLLAPYRPIRLS